MTVFQEGDLQFSFEEPWSVLKYDKDGGFYRTKGLEKLKGTKAVDFLCLYPGLPLLMLEAKDYSRGGHDGNAISELPMTVGEKIRDTLAGIIGGSHNAEEFDKGRFVEMRNKLSSPPRVILLFKDLDTTARRPLERAQVEKSTLFKKLKQSLRWLTRDVIVVGLDDYRHAISGLTVSKGG